MGDTNYEAFMAGVGTKLAELNTKIESGVATKNEHNQLADVVGEMSKRMDRNRLETKSNRVFGNEAEAHKFIDIMRDAVGKSDFSKHLTSESPFAVSKDINSYGTGTGSELIPTETASTISLLLSQGSVNRQIATVIQGIKGSLTLPKRNGTSTAVFTNGSSALKDDVAITASGASIVNPNVTLTPAQIAILSLVSEKALYGSAVNIAELVALDMIEQAGVLEDNSVIKGDGTVTYGTVTGIHTATGVGEQSVAFGSFSLDDVLNLPAKVHESVIAGGKAKYYMHPSILAALRQKKASTAGTYHLDPTTGMFSLGGYPIQLWSRMDSTVATGKFPCFFGDFSKALVVGLGQDLGIQVDRSYKFNTVQAAFRLAYDWTAAYLQPSAVARIACTS